VSVGRQYLWEMPLLGEGSDLRARRRLGERGGRGSGADAAQALAGCAADSLKALAFDLSDCASCTLYSFTHSAQGWSTQRLCGRLFWLCGSTALPTRGPGPRRRGGVSDLNGGGEGLFWPSSRRLASRNNTALGLAGGGMPVVLVGVHSSAGAAAVRCSR
jgi:hypothetical protein